MFSNRFRLQRRTGSKGVGRFQYLQQLVTEFQDTNSQEAKQQVLANLANFAYDPINFEFLRDLNVVDLFLDQLNRQSSPVLVKFALGGLCNLAVDVESRNYMVQKEALPLIVSCLSSPDEETVLSSITTLYYLACPETKSVLTSLPVLDCALRFSTSSNPRLKNVALAFLQEVNPDHHHLLAAKEAIPLPEDLPKQ